MPGSDIYEKRVLELNSAHVNDSGNWVIYWMQKTQRAVCNHALNFAIEAANELGKPLAVYFGIAEAYPMGSERVFKFMLEGLQETVARLDGMGISCWVRVEDPDRGIVKIAKDVQACLVVTDEDYVRVGREWRQRVAAELDIKFIQVDSDTIVPARNQIKEEWGAYTIRPKITKTLSKYMRDLPETSLQHMQQDLIEDCVDVSNLLELLGTLNFRCKVPPVENIRGGLGQARSRLQTFIEESLPDYAQNAGEIGIDGTSRLSPYLHFGQISPLEVALEISRADVSPESADAFLEQLIVRRELAINFCSCNPDYDNFGCAPDWARKTLDSHRHDPRPELYSLDELENACTHDELWNAAQRELLVNGTIHNYMRMLWAKKIAEWSPSPEEAMERAIYLNDKYALDGRDANGYTGIAWSILGKHDRPFSERAIFGKVRYMSTESTKRKKNWKNYIERTSNPV